MVTKGECIAFVNGINVARNAMLEAIIQILARTNESDITRDQKAGVHAGLQLLATEIGKIDTPDKIDDFYVENLNRMFS